METWLIAVMTGSSLPADPALRLQIGICSAETDGNEAVLEIVVASKVENGEEVHNTYGELSNSELLAKYGFALQSNPFNSVQVDKGIFLQKAEETLGTKHTRRRIKFLNKHRCADCWGKAAPCYFTDFLFICPSWTQK